MSTKQAEAPIEVTVELDLFSGRPNPQWKPAPSDVVRIVRVLPDGPGRMADGSDDAPLGFRGFIVTIETGVGRRRMHVHAGLIRSERATFADVDHRLETALAATLPSDLRRQFGSLIPHLPTP